MNTKEKIPKNNLRGGSNIGIGALLKKIKTFSNGSNRFEKLAEMQRHTLSVGDLLKIFGAYKM